MPQIIQIIGSYQVHNLNSRNVSWRKFVWTSKWFTGIITKDLLLLCIICNLFEILLIFLTRAIFWSMKSGCLKWLTWSFSLIVINLSSSFRVKGADWRWPHLKQTTTNLHEERSRLKPWKMTSMLKISALNDELHLSNDSFIKNQSHKREYSAEFQKFQQKQLLEHIDGKTSRYATWWSSSGAKRHHH